MFGRDMLLVENLLEMTVDVEIPSSIDMTNFPMTISFHLLQKTNPNWFNLDRSCDFLCQFIDILCQFPSGST